MKPGLKDVFMEENSPPEEESQLPAKANQELAEKKDDKPKRFVEKGRDVIFDNKTRLYWLKKDSWQVYVYLLFYGSFSS